MALPLPNIGTVRRFNDPALQAQIDKILSELPADHIAAALDVGFDEHGIQAVAVVKLDGGWSVIGAIDRRYSGEWGGKVGVRWSGR